MLAETCQLVATFACFVADRELDDPILRYGSPWKAYEALAAQLLLGNIGHHELVTVLADDYSTPHNVFFERDVKREVNRRLERLAVTSVCRLDSRAADPLQIVDLLTSAVAFEFRQSAARAGTASAKASLASSLRTQCMATSFLSGFRTGANSGRRFRVNVARYRASSPAHRRTGTRGRPR